MPSFLSKVFGRKKDDRDISPTNRLGSGELLGGKFEAISPTVSPSAAHYLELQSEAKIPAPDTDPEKEFGHPFFRTRSRPSSPGVKPKKLFDSLPPLSLDFDDVKDKFAYNGYIFEESNSEAIFPHSVIGQRRLNPMEALILIRACSNAIISRGVETLGIMTPHWYSTSPDVQHKLISRFLRSLDLTISSAAATPSSPYITDFEGEVNSTRSIHDVAAVFRWGLRHVQLEGDNFGTNDEWYKAFLNAEAANDYPPKAFSEKLAPSLPTSHLDLIVSALEVFSSLAAFSELNSTSGSKLSKIFGLWLLTARRVEEKDDWRNFYARWERTGRMLEHLFLARIRDQSTDQRMPTRLLELVQKYPYTHGLSSPKTDLQLLPYPQFTTSLHPALVVRVQYEVTSRKHIPKTKINPSVLLADAFSTKVVEGEFVELWAKITEAASRTGTELPLGSVLANESLRFLSLVADKSKEVKSPTFSLLSLVEPRQQHASSNGVAPIKPGMESAPISTAPLSPINIGGDWEHFSASGFLDVDQPFPPLASTLFDTDIEKTVPLPISRKSSKRAGRKSLELPRSLITSESNGEFSSPEFANSKSPPKERQQVITASHLEVVDIDEAFVDFWSDALLDPIASDWPAFVVCKFKPDLIPDLTFGTGDDTTRKTLRWLVLEQVYSVKPLPVPSPPLTTEPTSVEAPMRPASPITQSPSGRRLFNFWSMSRTPSTSSTGSQKTKKTLKTPKVGEMGELIEEDEGKKNTINVKLPGSKKFKSLDLPGVKRLAVKKSDKLEEKGGSVDVARPETSASPAGAVIVAATTVAVVQQEIKEEDLSTAPEPVVESSTQILRPGPTNDAPKQDFVPAEGEVVLADVGKEDIATLRTAVPEPDVQIVDAKEVPETTIVTNGGDTEVPSKGEVVDVGSHVPDEVQPLVSELEDSFANSSSLPLASPVELGQTLTIPTIGERDTSEKPIVDEVTVVSEEFRTSGKDERLENSEANSQKSGLEGVSSAVVAMTTADSTVSEVVKPQVADEVPAPVADLVAIDSEKSVITTEPALIVANEPQATPAVEVYPELDERGASIEENQKSIADAPTEVYPFVQDTAEQEALAIVEEMDAGELLEEDLPPSSPTVDTTAIEEVVPAVKSSTIYEVLPVLDNTAVIQDAEEFLGAAEIADQSVEVREADGGAAIGDSPTVEAGHVVETTAGDIAAELSGEPTIEEFRAPEAPVEAGVEEPNSFLNASVQEFSPSEAEPLTNTVILQETTEELFPEEQPTTELPSTTFEAEESTTVSEGMLVGAVAPILKVEPESAIDQSVGGILETQESSDEIPVSAEVPPVDAIIVSEDLPPSIEAPALEIPSEALAPEPEVTPAELTSEEDLKRTGTEELLAPEAIPAAEDETQELSTLEETPIQPETEERPSVEPQPLTEETHEGPDIASEELPVVEPDLSVKEPEMAKEEVPTDVSQLAAEADAANDAPLVAQDEVVFLDAPISEALMPEDETPLGVPEQAEGTLESAIPTTEDARVEEVPILDDPVAEVEQASEATVEIRESDAPISESVTASVSEEPLPVAEPDEPVDKSDVEQPSASEEPILGGENAFEEFPSRSEEPVPIPDERLPADPLTTASPSSAITDVVEQLPVAVEEQTITDDAEQPAAMAHEDLVTTEEVIPQPEAETPAELPQTSPVQDFHEPEQEDNATTVPKEVPADIDQPVVETGIVDEPIVVESAAGDDSFVEPIVHDAPSANMTEDIPHPEEEPTHTNNQDEDTTTTANDNGGDPSISENEVVKLAAGEASPFITDAPTVGSEEPAAQSEVLASEPPNEDGHAHIATEATDATIVAPSEDDVDSANVKIIVDESRDADPSEVDTDPEKLNDGIDVDASLEVATEEA